MTKSAEKKYVLGKIETTEGTDSTPTVGANALVTFGLDASALEGTQEVRQLDGQFAGARPSVITQLRKPVPFNVEIAGSGVSATTVPAWMPFLRICGFDAGTVGGSSVTQALINPWTAPSMTLWPMLDNLKLASLGSRSGLTLTYEDGKVPFFGFSTQGFPPANVVSEATLGALTYVNQAAPVVVSTANTTFSLGGFSAPFRRITFDLGNKLEPRSLAGQNDKVLLRNREITGNALIEFPDLGTKNYYTNMLARTIQVLDLNHGTVAGNIVELDASSAEIGVITTPEDQGFLMASIPFRLLPTAAGNDELVVISK